MTAFDRIFDESAKASGLTWTFIFGQKELNVLIDRSIEQYPCIIRSFNEPLLPLFDSQQRVQRDLNLYIINLGFIDVDSSDVSAGLEDIMSKFIVFRDLLRRAGITVDFKQTPSSNWMQFDCDEYGYIFDLTCTYSLCLT